MIVGRAVETAVTSSALRTLQTTMARKESQNAEPLDARFPAGGGRGAGGWRGRRRGSVAGGGSGLRPRSRSQSA